MKILELSKNKCESVFNETCEKISKITEEEIINKSIQNNNMSNELFPIKITNMEKFDDKNNLLKIETIFGKQFYLWIIVHLLEETSKILHNHKWGIITVDDNVILSTTDNPVICLNYNNKNDYNFNGGWNQKKCNILFPISPKKIYIPKLVKKLSRDGTLITI